MKKAIAVLGLLSIVVGLAIWETHYIKKTINVMNTNCQTLYESVTQDDIDFDALQTQIIDTNRYWTKREKVLCLFVSHKDMSNISDYIEYLLASAKNNAKNDCLTYALLLQENMKYLGHLISFNIFNIF